MFGNKEKKELKRLRRGMTDLGIKSLDLLYENAVAKFTVNDCVDKKPVSELIRWLMNETKDIVLKDNPPSVMSTMFGNDPYSPFRSSTTYTVIKKGSSDDDEDLDGTEEEQREDEELKADLADQIQKGIDETVASSIANLKRMKDEMKKVHASSTQDKSDESKKQMWVSLEKGESLIKDIDEIVKKHEERWKNDPS